MDKTNVNVKCVNLLDMDPFQTKTEPFVKLVLSKEKKLTIVFITLLKKKQDVLVTLVIMVSYLTVETVKPVH